jgi:hypothetical protein
MKNSAIGSHVNKFYDSKESFNLKQLSIDEPTLRKKLAGGRGHPVTSNMKKLNLTAFTVKDYSTIGTALTVGNSFTGDGNNEYELLSKQSQEQSDVPG